jgi:hypothetical protein
VAYSAVVPQVSLVVIYAVSVKESFKFPAEIELAVVDLLIAYIVGDRLDAGT